MSQSTVKSYVSGPRWAGLSSFLRKLSWMYDLEIEINSEKSFLSETVFYKVTGENDDLLRFMTTLKSSVRDYNK